MKKIIVGFVICFATTLVANSDILYWYVDSTSFAKSGSDSSLWYSSLYQYDSSTDTMTGLGGDWGTGTKSAYTSATNPSAYSYYIEVASYDSSSGTYANSYYTGAFSYSELHVAATQMTASYMQSIWSGKTTTAGHVPEPTSGLMMLVGMALLGLKRRRV